MNHSHSNNRIKDQGNSLFASKFFEEFDFGFSSSY
jgi:hypothetical protein